MNTVIVPSGPALIGSAAELEQLWQMDNEEYDENSLPWLVFLDWWQRYEFGLNLVKVQGEIRAAIGTWALSEADEKKFLDCCVLERELQPLTVQELRSHPAAAWYVSGIFTRVPPESLNGRLRTLLSTSMGAKAASGHTAYPARLYAIGCTKEGISLLDRFGFKLIGWNKTGPLLPIYARSISSYTELIPSRKRGVAVGT